MTTTLIITSLLFCTALQSRWPTLWWLGGLRLEFLPAVVAYAALSVKRWPALLFAVAAGLMQDSLSAGPFGVTAAVYATITALLTGMHQAFDRELPWVQMGAGALLTAATGAAAGVVVGFSAGATVKILALATFSTLITPLLFLFLDWLLASWRRT